ncbi:methyl-accepting chemotaxis protein [Rhodobacter capsulatus]|uniref:methyl-accepting chemotaxis protein n=1 Tax=Rhodobacter capsulatus TaxID=1061 RepID=UPI0011425094|nr:methyl-accepting chemotaxis protein [Rhodobacter capsulatus]MDS0926598.1 methyl-accepting chemotaxis protein [Rhodobacter capsulatus]TQD37573.1 methyl-accepting chemotaxis protein [Rhodobacter capsulatus]
MADFRAYLGGIGVQVGLCAGLFALLLAVLGWTSHQGLSRFQAQTRAMAEDRLPDLRATSTLVAQISALPQGFAQLLQAPDTAAVSAAHAALAARIERFAATPEAAAVPGLGAHFTGLQARLAALTGALADRMAAEAALAQALKDIDSVLATVVTGFNAYEPKDVIRLRTEIIRILTETDPAAFGPRGRKFAEAAEKVARSVPEAKAAGRARLLDLAGPESGLVALRQNVLRAGAEASGRAEEALAATEDITTEVTAAGLAVIDSAAADIGRLDGDAERTNRAFSLVLAGAVAVLVGVVLALRALIVQPLRRLTARTRGLAAGDLGVLDDMRRRGGEIGALQAALLIFRDMLAQNARLAEAAQQAAAEREADHRAQIARERAAERAEAARAEERRAAEAEAEAARRALEAAAAEERAAQLAEQSQIVAALETGLHRLAAGDLTARIETPFPPHSESLRANFNAALDALAALVRTIRDSTDGILSTSAALDRGAEEMSAQAARAAASLEETAAAMTELAGSSRTGAARAAETAQSAERMRADIQTAQATVNRVVEAMGRITASSDAIARIISVIDDISFQTNLLALNAGVEAARAGEAGRGFAVVASEVRDLAQRTTAAAAEIGGLITEARSKVGEGETLVGEADRGLAGAVAVIEAIVGHVQDLAQLSREQSASIGEVTAATEVLDLATQKSAEGVERTAHSGRDLLAAAQSLSQAIARFDLGSGVAPAAPSRAA